MTQSTDPEAHAGAISLLLVEEDDRAAERLFEMLNAAETSRFDVSRVQNIEDALAQLQGASYDVMLIDLPVDEGYGLDSLMRARVATSHVPIVLLTFHRDETLALKAARAGAQDYLTKGEATPELICRTLVHAVERHRILRELTGAQQRQHFLATHDTLTELPNRHSFLQQLRIAMKHAHDTESQIAVLFFDLDGFKSVNDSRGHAIGDELLVDVAKRLRRNVRKNDLVARFGGDEFVAAVRDVSDDAMIIRVADHIRSEIEKPYHLNGSEFWISMSIGIALYPRDTDDADTLICCADAAMYRAKSTGKNQVCLFKSEMNDDAAERFALVNGLREAIHSGQLVLLYQPQVCVESRRIIGAETLLRWRHPTRGLVSASEFIAVVEETGMIIAIGEWVLRTACETAAGWTHLSDIRLAVNISGRQLEQPTFPDRVRRILDETGLAPQRLELELTESLATSERALEALGRLREMGIRTAIDDFGTGYSSLTLLKRLPVDVLKIDQSFVRDATSSDSDAVILEAVITMARGLGLDLIAEGVETREEMEWLQERGCTLMQGYLFAVPLSKQELDVAAADRSPDWRAILDHPEKAEAPVEVAVGTDDDLPSLPGIRIEPRRR